MDNEDKTDSKGEPESSFDSFLAEKMGSEYDRRREYDEKMESKYEDDEDDCDSYYSDDCSMINQDAAAMIRRDRDRDEDLNNVIKQDFDFGANYD